MRKICLCIVAIISVSMLHAQTAGDSVKAAVKDLFTAMTAADSAGIVHAFTEDAILQSIQDAGSISVKDERIVDFAHVIAGLKKGDADERIKFDVIKVDGPLAIVWTPYQFYYKGSFTHCGVDSYQVLRVNGQWKIHYLIDTRRKGGCM